MARQPNAKPPAPVLNGHDGGEPIIEIDGTADDVTLEVDGGGTPPIADPGIEALRKQLEESNARAAAAETERDQLRNARRNDATEIADTRLLVIDGTITAKETEKREVTAKLIAAKEAGDYAAEVAATDELQQLNIDIRQAKVGKSRLEHEIEEAKNGGTQQRASNDDPIEQYIASTQNMHPKAAKWVRDHRDYVLDTVKNAELVLAHQRAIRAGHEINSPAYFEALESNLGLGDEREEVQTEERPNEQQQQARTPPAPVSRSANLGGGARQIADGIVDLGNGKFKVSAEVAEAAAFSGITIEEYIKQASKLTRGSDGQLH